MGNDFAVNSHPIQKLPKMSSLNPLFVPHKLEVFLIRFKVLKQVHFVCSQALSETSRKREEKRGEEVQAEENRIHQICVCSLDSLHFSLQ